jgi:phosphohistidine phosphatase
MKTLYIVRHGKSSWEYNVPDDERPLLEKGIKRTKKIAAYLHAQGIKPDMMISSHAVRALETAKIIAAALDYPTDDIHISRQLYHAFTDNIYDELYQVSDMACNVMIFGHNPTFTAFANHFLEPKIDWLPTSGLVVVDFQIDSWTELSMAKHKPALIISPKDL